MLAISHAQSVRLKQQGFKVAVFYNTVNKDTYSSQKTDAGYLCCLGTMKPEKGHDLAIRIARAAGKPLIIGGVPDSRPTNQLHFVNHVQPAITIYDPGFFKAQSISFGRADQSVADDLISKTGTVSPVIYVGGVNDEEKATLFGFAQATLFPVRLAGAVRPCHD